MILYPPAKINLGLYIIRRRKDGFHDIETLFYPLGLTDILEFVPVPGLIADELTISGLEVPGTLQNNLLLKVCRLLRERKDVPFLKIHLHKRIPMGAGLGGGSSDASSLLLALNGLLEDPLPMEELAEMALQIGSDCPFFLQSGPSIGRGRGEILSSYPIRLTGWYFCLFHPGIHVSTAEAYSQVKFVQSDPGLERILSYPVNEWKSQLLNQFENSVFKLHPEIGSVKELVYDSGAEYAAMSGSGSAVFGLFKTRPVLPERLSRILVWEEALGE